MAVNVTDSCIFGPDNGSNISHKCDSSHNVEEPFSILVAGNVLVVTVSVLSILCTGFALRILVLCKKTPLQIRYLSANFLVSFIIFDTSIALHSLAIIPLQVGGMQGAMLYIILFDSRVICASVLVATIWGSLCAISVDRVLALIMPFNHSRYATKLVLKIAIVLLWLFNIGVPASIFIATVLRVCGQGNIILTCDLRLVRLASQTGLLSLYAVLIFISCILILRVAFQHKRRLDKFTKNETYLADLTKIQKFSKSTKTILMIIIAFICFYFPIFLHSTVFEYMPQLKTPTWKRIFLFLDYFGHQLNIYASLYIYIWKFKECRMHFYLTLSRFDRKYVEAASALRIEIYGIVTKARQEKQNS